MEHSFQIEFRVHAKPGPSNGTEYTAIAELVGDYDRRSEAISFTSAGDALHDALADLLARHPGLSLADVGSN